METPATLERSTKRRCLFCSSFAGSAEHVFANWFNGVFPQTSVGEITVTLDSVDTSGLEAHRQYSTSEVAALTTKEVCHECNTGWMSRLEGSVSNWLKPMMLGGRATLDQHQLLVVASWATKTAMVLDACSGTERNYSFEQRSFLRQNNYPPSGICVRAAQYEGSEGPLTYFFAKVLRNDGVTNIGLHTLHIGTLVLQVCTYLPTWANPYTFHILPPISDYDISVYPPTENWTWPRTGTKTLDDERLGKFARRFWELGLVR